MGRHTLSILLLSACLGGGFALRLSGGEPSISAPDEADATPVATEPAPAVAAPAPVTTAPAPPRMRDFTDEDLLPMLTAALQKDFVGDKGQLELAFTRAWKARSVPDEPLTVKIVELPNAGVAAFFIVRFELFAAERSLGTWQASLRAHVWRDIWVARSSLLEGTPVATADIVRERHDVLMQHGTLADFNEGDPNLEMAEPLQSGSPLLARSVRVRPVIHRGQFADALIQEGTLSVSMKVEVLEDGAPGQIIHARNPQSRRNLSGKVMDEKTILVSL